MDPTCLQPRGQEQPRGGGVAHQVALRGDTDEDEVIPNANLFSFGPLLGGWVHRPPTGFAYGGRILRMTAAQNSLPEVFPVLSLPSLRPQILLLLPPTLPQFPLPALRPSAYDSPMLAQVSPSKFVHSHPETLCPKVLVTPGAFPCLPHDSVDLHPNFLPVLSLPHPAPSGSSTCRILLQSHVEGQLVGHGAGSSEAAQVLGSQSGVSLLLEGTALPAPCPCPPADALTMLLCACRSRMAWPYRSVLCPPPWDDYRGCWGSEGTE